MENLIIPILVITFVVIAAIFGQMQARQRRNELAAFCRRQGWSFAPEQDKMLADRYPSVQCLNRGHSRYAYNRIFGIWNGRDFCAFDYHYVTGHGKHKQTHVFSVVILSCDIPLKPLFIRPEGFFDKVSEFFGMDDIDFESAQFSREFHVSSPDKKWAYDVIHPRMMEYLMAAPRLSIQFDRSLAIAHGIRRSPMSPQEFEATIRLLEGVLNRLPEYLVRQQRDAAYS